MELDELKTTWMVLEKQLKKNETLNKQLLSEMLHKKSNKSLNRLVNTDFIDIIMLLLAIPAGVWIYNADHYFMGSFLSVKMFAIVYVTAVLIGVIWNSYNLRYLMKIDFSKSVKNNMYYINKYDIMIKRGKIANYTMFPVMFFLCAFIYYEFKAGILSWTFLIVVIAIGIIITFWMYKKIYDPNVQSIKQKLDELKELDEKVLEIN